MTLAVEVATEKALIDRLLAFTVSPSIPVALPNVEFLSKPTPGHDVFWLRATFLPAESFALSLDYGGDNQHYGIFQVDVFYYQGDGEYRPGAIATDIIAWFKRGTKMTQDGFIVETGVGDKIPKRERMIKDDPWVMIPVSIPYRTFAPNPA